MLRALLAGAGLSALLDVALGLPMADGARLPREFALLTIAGTLGMALLFGLGALLALRVQRFAGARARFEQGRSFWAGAALGAMPIAAAIWPEVFFPEAGKQVPNVLLVAGWLFVPFLLLLAAPPVPRFLRPGSPALNALALAAPAAWLVYWLLPSAVPPGFGEPPDYREEPLMVTGEPAPRLPQDERPDLVLVSIDTLRSDLSHSGREVLPFLEELRARSLWHERGYSTSNQTVPGHVGMLTGLEPDQHLLGQNKDFGKVDRLLVERGEPFLAQKLHSAGYRTSCVISNAMAQYFAPPYETEDVTRASYGARHFFVRTVGKSGWLARVLNARRAQDLIAAWLRVQPSDLLPPGMGRHATEQAIQYHRQMVEAGGRPLHLFVHYMDPHSPYTPPAETAGRFAREDGLPEGFQAWEDDHRTLINKVRQALQSGREPLEEAAHAAAAHMRDWYDEEIFALDVELRRLVAELEESGRPTLLVITSDHGEHFGEHDLMEHSNSLYQELLGVPFVVLGLNGVDTPATRLPGPPSVIDVVPTMLKAAGVPYLARGAAGLRGVDLLDAEARAQLADRQLLASWSSPINGFQVAVIEGGRKLIGRIIPPSSAGGHDVQIEELAAFDLNEDASESRNLVAISSEGFVPLRDRLREVPERWLALDYFAPNHALTEQEQAMLEALGYGDAATTPAPNRAPE